MVLLGSYSPKSGIAQTSTGIDSSSRKRSRVQRRRGKRSYHCIALVGESANSLLDLSHFVAYSSRHLSLGQVSMAASRRCRMDLVVDRRVDSAPKRLDDYRRFLAILVFHTLSGGRPHYANWAMGSLSAKF